MAHKPEKFISTLFKDENSSLNKLITKVNQLDELDAKIKKFLSTEFINRVTVTNFRHGCLILQVENGAWATKLRFQIPELLSKLRNEGQIPDLVAINVVVRP